MSDTGNALGALRAKHALELDKLSRETALQEKLPLRPSKVFWHESSYTAKFGKSRFPDRHTIREALEIYKAFESMRTERTLKLGAEFVRVYAAINLVAGTGYVDHVLEFAVSVENEPIVWVLVEILPPARFLPLTDFQYDRDSGDCIKSSVRPVAAGADRIVNMWAPPGNYRVLNIWHTQESFEKFAQQFTKSHDADAA